MKKPGNARAAFPGTSLSGFMPDSFHAGISPGKFQLLILQCYFRHPPGRLFSVGRKNV
jgi:hypothetical protein